MASDDSERATWRHGGSTYPTRQAMIECPHCKRNIYIIPAAIHTRQPSGNSAGSAASVNAAPLAVPGVEDQLLFSRGDHMMPVFRREVSTMRQHHFIQRGRVICCEMMPGEFQGEPLVNEDERDYAFEYVRQIGSRQCWHFWAPGEEPDPMEEHYEGLRELLDDARLWERGVAWHEFCSLRYDSAGGCMSDLFWPPEHRDFHDLCPGTWERHALRDGTDMHGLTYPSEWPSGKQPLPFYQGVKMECIWSLVKHGFLGSTNRWGTRRDTLEDLAPQVWGFKPEGRDQAARRYARGVSLLANRQYQLCVAEGLYYKADDADSDDAHGSANKRRRLDEEVCIHMDVHRTSLVAIWTCDVTLAEILSAWAHFTDEDKAQCGSYIYMLQSIWDPRQEFPVNTTSWTLPDGKKKKR